LDDEDTKDNAESIVFGIVIIQVIGWMVDIGLQSN